MTSKTETASEGSSPEGEEPPEGFQPVLDRAARLLPAQGPISIFVHHNTLHAFEDLPFEEAVVRAGELFGCEPYLPEWRYRDELRSGRILDRDLVRVVDDELGSAGDDAIGGLASRRDLRLAMLRHAIRPHRGRRAGVAPGGNRRRPAPSRRSPRGDPCRDSLRCARPATDATWRKVARAASGAGTLACLSGGRRSSACRRAVVAAAPRSPPRPASGGHRRRHRRARASAPDPLLRRVSGSGAGPVGDPRPRPGDAALVPEDLRTARRAARGLDERSGRTCRARERGRRRRRGVHPAIPARARRATARNGKPSPWRRCSCSADGEASSASCSCGRTARPRTLLPPRSAASWR